MRIPPLDTAVIRAEFLGFSAVNLSDFISALRTSNAFCCVCGSGLCFRISVNVISAAKRLHGVYRQAEICSYINAGFAASAKRSNLFFLILVHGKNLQSKAARQPL